MAELSWAVIVRLVYERANRCCEYCHTCEEFTGQPMHVEHINPFGGDDSANLCLSCASCNLSKAQAMSAIDPETGELAPLFNPRLQQWAEHFVWIDGGERIAGKTSVGRATVERLKMNIERVVIARRTWIKAGGHPPSI